jgi:hypothetical protein
MTYLPVVASNGAGNGRHGHLVVDAVHVLVVDLRNWRVDTTVRAGEAAVDSPAAVWRSACRVVLGRRLLEVGAPERCGDSEGLLGWAGGLVISQEIVDVARRGWRDVHGRASGRVLCRFSVRMVLVGRLVVGHGRHGCRGPELGCHNCVCSAKRWCAVAYTVVEGFEGCEGMQLIRTDFGGEGRTLLRSR